MHPHISYLVCTAPRSGSTLLCEALTNTGIAGHPKEYFEDLRATGRRRQPIEYFSTCQNPNVLAILGNFVHVDNEPTLAQRWGTTNYSAYLERVLADGTTHNGVFGAKMMWGYLDDFISNLRDIPAYQEMPVIDLLAAIFPNLHYIWVKRQDKVRQAVSLWKAIQTWTWRMDEIPTSPIHHPHELRFHFEAIDYLVQQYKEHEAAWCAFFKESGIQPFEVIYEELAQAYEATALDILRYLSIPIPPKLVFAERSMKQQADELSEAWVQCYHQCKQSHEPASQP